MFEEKYQQQPALWELWTEGPRSCGKNRLLVVPQLRQFPQRFAPPQFRYAGSGAEKSPGITALGNWICVTQFFSAESNRWLQI